MDDPNSDFEGAGSVLYPGIKQIVGVSYTRSHGITPDICRIEMAPQTLDPKDKDYVPIEPDGFLIFQFDTVKVNTDLFGRKTTVNKTIQILMQSCRADRASVRRSETSENWTIPIFDRRWKWQFGSFSGHWNTKKNGVIEKRKEKTVRELAEMCLDAMGEIKYETKTLDELEKNKKISYRKKVRPEVHWDRIPPAQALNDLLTPLGYRVCLGWDDIVRIEKQGVGALLPTEDLMSGGFDAELPETPDSVTVLGGITMHEALWELEPVGLDLDGDWRPINHLSYAPFDSQGNAEWEFSIPPNYPEIRYKFDEIKFDQTPSDDEYRKRKEQYTLAVQTVYRSYRLKYPVGTKEDESLRKKYDDLGYQLGLVVDLGHRAGEKVYDNLLADYEQARRKLFQKAKPVIPGPQAINPKTGYLDDIKLIEFEQILPIFETRAELAVDSYTGKLIRKPPQVSGIFYDPMRVGDTLTTDELLNTIEVSKFRVLPELGIIQFNEPITRREIIKGKKGKKDQKLEYPADLRVLIATPLKNLAGEPARFTHVEELDPKFKTKPAKLPLDVIVEKPTKVPKGTGTKVVIKNEIVQAYQAQYETKTNLKGEEVTEVVKVLDNVVEEELEKQALIAVDVENIKIFTEDSGSGVYAGLKKINLDGAIQQVAISRTTSGGMTTTISRNTEVKINVPNFDQRQRNLALKEMIKNHTETIDNTDQVNTEGT
ncbi:hypothetical protein [Gimesia aquarii]|uniref:Uncharacterized protein n=1 Tax=Gimesia aquarii TaxID=2527964 RepID=A0A517WNL4_9PLAN|nr:hypothetical protein [Gimesia aquarii]QDU06839.1 hypothetical protein V202x_01820 [Gimesia aquarii]